ncbi:MAG TPA: NAD(P)(+) transhydrogenase (Re/Si-specific) subunit beta, partial [Emcibacteraceae bacterium]|nr:NAD(P)(+) transhydrogenase (Re/Si-specific) subunit beta [Emcibacteraceae bacterium]
MMSEQNIVDITAIAYLIAGVLFILALRGLSSPESSRKGNYYGMVGMTLAIATTLANPEIVSYTWIIVALAIGGGIGLLIASRIAMTA